MSNGDHRQDSRTASERAFENGDEVCGPARDTLHLSRPDSTNERAAPRGNSRPRVRATGRPPPSRYERRGCWRSAARSVDTRWPKEYRRPGKSERACGTTGLRGCRGRCTCTTWPASATLRACPTGRQPTRAPVRRRRARPRPAESPRVLATCLQTEAAETGSTATEELPLSPPLRAAHRPVATKNWRERS